MRRDTRVGETDGSEFRLDSEPAREADAAAAASEGGQPSPANGPTQGKGPTPGNGHAPGNGRSRFDGRSHVDGHPHLDGVAADAGCTCQGNAAPPATDTRATGTRGLPQGSRNGRSRPVMIAGGAGFIGTNLAARLLDQGHDVLVFDNLSRPGVERNLCWLTDRYRHRVHVEVQDIRDPLAVRHAVARSSAVFHLAAQVAVTSSLVEPVFDFEVNARGTLNVLEACRGCSSPPPLLFTSTNKVYGSLPDIRCVREGAQYVPSCPTTRAHGISEERPLQFHSPYGCSKGAADQYVLDYARCYGLPAVVFRMSCIYGPHQCGTEDQGWLAHFARRIIADDPISIYGDGRQVRDVLFVSDLVKAMLMATDQIEATAGQAFNIGGGPQQAVSLLQVIDQLAELQGTRPAVEYGPWRQGDQKYYVSDTRRFQATTGWSREVDVEQGVERLWRWLSDAVVEQPAVTSV